MTHIALSEICDEIFQKNNAVAEEICTTVKNILRPIIDKIDNAEKGDECIIVMIYVRKGNDVLVSGDCAERISSTVTSTDKIVARDRFNYLLTRRNNDDTYD